MRRIGCFQQWASHIGLKIASLELVVACGLKHISQAGFLLSNEKHTTNNLKEVFLRCSDLNSRQICRLLEGFLAEPNEPAKNADFCLKLIANAQNTVDNVSLEANCALKLDGHLKLTYLQPEGGFACELFKDLPGDFLSFVTCLESAYECRVLTSNAINNNSWMCFMEEAEQVISNIIKVF